MVMIFTIIEKKSLMAGEIILSDISTLSPA
jgi:hypothetical protein